MFIVQENIPTIKQKLKLYAYTAQCVIWENLPETVGSKTSGWKSES